ncbi:MAG TPA: phosphoribosyltransferase [Polyangiaceae bacterium]|nr:phosphoribosyltransferase [Polyangiaceae bacterium]
MGKRVYFDDRRDAGRQLALKLSAYAGARPLVLGLPRGGVPVAYEVARALSAPLDVFVVRKLGVPDNEELAMGAVASGGALVVNDEVVERFGIPAEVVARAAEVERGEVERRERAFRGGRPMPDLRRRTVLLVDDGLATGATMRAAVSALRKMKPARLVVAVPISDPDVCDEFRHLADDAVCAVTPEPLFSVGLWYRDFTQTGDDEVRELLARAALEREGAVPPGATPS